MNSLLRPLLTVLTCPLIVVTLGLFTLVINALMLLVTGWLSARWDLGFAVSGFWPAFWGGLVVGLVSLAALAAPARGRSADRRGRTPSVTHPLHAHSGHPPRPYIAGVTDLQLQPAPSRHPADLRDPSLYLNRELSWLEFNRRVLHEAHDPRTPLLERLKFLAHLQQQPRRVLPGPGRRPQAAGGGRHRRAHRRRHDARRTSSARSPRPCASWCAQHRRCLMHEVLPALAEHGVHAASEIGDLAAGGPGAPGRLFPRQRLPGAHAARGRSRAIPSPTSRT